MLLNVEYNLEGFESIPLSHRESRVLGCMMNKEFRELFLFHGNDQGERFYEVVLVKFLHILHISYFGFSKFFGRLLNLYHRDIYTFGLSYIREEFLADALALGPVLFQIFDKQFLHLCVSASPFARIACSGFDNQSMFYLIDENWKMEEFDYKWNIFSYRITNNCNLIKGQAK